MSEFEILIPLALFTFVFIIISRIVKNRHERKKWEFMRAEEARDGSLTTSELHLMIEDAVARATMGIEERLDRLERPMLEGFEEQVPAEKTVGRQSVR